MQEGTNEADGSSPDQRASRSVQRLFRSPALIRPMGVPMSSPLGRVAHGPLGALTRPMGVPM